MACALAAAVVAGVGPAVAARSAAALDVSTCPGGGSDAGWTLSTTTNDPASYRHAFVALSLKTRRPDLAPTDNLARCRPAQASSEEPGMYAEAAVDGSPATIWALAPDQSSGSLQVDLGKKAPIGRIIPHWTDAAPVSYQVLTSGAGPIWRFGGRGRWQARSRR